MSYLQNYRKFKSIILFFALKLDFLKKNQFLYLSFITFTMFERAIFHSVTVKLNVEFVSKNSKAKNKIFLL